MARMGAARRGIMNPLLFGTVMMALFFGPASLLLPEEEPSGADQRHP
jgi:hypothetical protein